MDKTIRTLERQAAAGDPAAAASLAVARRRSRTYLERFQDMVAELGAHPQVRITHYRVAPPASEAEIERVETALGWPLPEAVKAFYRQANGIQLRWLDVDSPAYDASRDESSQRGSAWVDDQPWYADYDQASGVVDLLPIGELFVDASYEEQLWFDWMTDEDTQEFGRKKYPQLSFHKAIRPCDTFSKYNFMVFFVEPKRLRVLMSDDHGACWDGSRITDFASYLEFILTHRGGVESRRSAFGAWGGHRKRPLSFSAREPLPIDELIETNRAEED